MTAALIGYDSGSLLVVKQAPRPSQRDFRIVFVGVYRLPIGA
jgi:hypothetical protein